MPLATLRAPTLNRLKTVVFLLCLYPVARLLALGLGLGQGLGANPIEFITRSTGTWTLSFLLITLGVTPLRKLTGWNWLARLRRMLGLYAFFYVCLHFLTYIWLDQFFDVPGMLRDIVKRPFITVGFAAFVLLWPLALTSTHAMMKRLGRHWARLHKAIYLIAVLGVVHYWWLVKKDITLPLIFAGVLLCLLCLRLIPLDKLRAAIKPTAQSPSRSDGPRQIPSTGD